jgi:hypothetical protein
MTRRKTQRAIVGWPHNSRSVASNSALRVPVKLQAEVTHAGPANTRYSPDPPIAPQEPTAFISSRASWRFE